MGPDDESPLADADADAERQEQMLSGLIWAVDGGEDEPYTEPAGSTFRLLVVSAQDGPVVSIS